MLWALLALLGVPIWLVLGALGAGTINRRRFQRSPGVFPMRMREVNIDNRKWGKKVHARWVHDVLLTNVRFALVFTVPYGTHKAINSPTPADPATVKGLGDDIESFTLELDDHTKVEIAYSTENRHLAAGPYDPAAVTRGH